MILNQTSFEILTHCNQNQVKKGYNIDLFV
jgi:hypothetical protein